MACRQFPRPEYRDLQLLRKVVLGGVTQRDALCTCLHVVKAVLSKPGGLAVVQAAAATFRSRVASESRPLGIAESHPRAQRTTDARSLRMRQMLREVVDKGVSINLEAEIRALVRELDEGDARRAAAAG